MESVINALVQALEVNPSDVNLRQHLATTLLQDSQFTDALQHSQTILAQAPDNITALETAITAARELNNTALADSYQRLLQALQPNATPQNDATRINSDADHDTDDADITPERQIGKPKLKVVGGTQPTNPESNELKNSLLEEEDVTITLADVGGMQNVKASIEKTFLAPLRNPEIAQMYGQSTGGGLLLYGPPGCGKTWIARALAGELGARFFTVGLSDVLDMYIGQSERNLHEIFETARRESPAVLFFDEIDAIGQKRSQLRNSGMRTVVNQLLAELDSVNSDNTNLYILAATNHPWDIDTALRRPGRLDRMVAVFPPDETARLAILHTHLEKRPLADDVDIAKIAQQTDGFSGADLKFLCQQATENALEKALQTGNTAPISQADFVAALPSVKPSTRPWFETARNYAMFANDGGSYDDLLSYIRTHNL